MRSSRVLRLGVGFKPRTPPPSRPPRSPSSLNRLSEAKRAKPGKPGVFPPTAQDPQIFILHFAGDGSIKGHFGVSIKSILM